MIEKYLQSLLGLVPDTQKGYYEWLLAVGEDQSKNIRMQKEDVSFWLLNMSESKKCYKNSMLPVLSGATPYSIEYVEGYYITSLINIPLEHAWNIKDDGELVDFTALHNDIKVLKYFGVTVPTYLLKDYHRHNIKIPLLIWWYYTKIIGRVFIAYDAGGYWDMCEFNKNISWHLEERYRGNYAECYLKCKEENLKR